MQLQRILLKKKLKKKLKKISFLSSIFLLSFTMKNKKIIVNVGIPGSGKTTYSKEFVSSTTNWVRVCRDDYRFMLQNLPMLPGKGEVLVTDLVFSTAKKALLSGFNVILDATHVQLKYINQVVEELGEMAEIEFNLFDTPLEVCIERDLARDRTVGEDIIKKMHENLENLKKEFDFQSIPQKSRIKTDISKNWEGDRSDLRYAFITDIDGTVAHMNGKRGPFDWSKVGLDDPDMAVILTLRALKSTGATILAVSGRDGSCRKETEEWLRKYEVPFDALFMRPTGDFRKDSLIKKEIYEKDIKDNFNVVMVFDDRDQVVETWRKLGLKCAQVEPGMF